MVAGKGGIITVRFWYLDLPVPAVAVDCRENVMHAPACRYTRPCLATGVSPVSSPRYAVRGGLKNALFVLTSRQTPQGVLIPTLRSQSRLLRESGQSLDPRAFSSSIWTSTDVELLDEGLV